jgi:hypothetical protein
MFWQTEPAGLSDQAQNITLAELAVRNGSLDNFDRRGEVIFMDDFSGNLNKFPFSGTVGYTATQSTTLTENKDVSLKLVTAGANGNIVTVGKGLPFASLSKFSFQYNVALPSVTKGTYDFIVSVYDGTNVNQGGMQYDAVNDKIKYYNGSSWVDLATGIILEPITSVPIFHSMKLVIDPVKGKYHRIILNNNLYEIPTIALGVAAAATNPLIYVQFTITNTDANSLTTYLSKIIIKQNEP